MEKYSLCQDCKKGKENTCRYFQKDVYAKVVDCGMFVPDPEENALEVATRWLKNKGHKK